MIRLSLPLLALLVPLLSAAPQASDPIAQAVAERTAEATAAAASAAGTAALLRLDELRDYVSDPGALDGTLEKVAASPTTDAFTRTSARLLLLQSERDRAQLSAARAESAALGFIQSVYVLGSFENEGKSGCDTDFGPEASLDLLAAYPAKGQPAHWRPLTLKALDGAVDLGAALHPNRSVVAYALALLDEPGPRRVTLGLAPRAHSASGSTARRWPRTTPTTRRGWTRPGCRCSCAGASTGFS
jgi:hypothetical protein